MICADWDRAKPNPKPLPGYVAKRVIAHQSLRMFETLLWWFLLELIGIAVLPIAFRFFRNLPDRGYAFIKPLGLLLIAYPFWLLTSFGFLSNTRGAVLGVGIVVAGCAWYFGGRGDKSDQRQMTLEPSSITRNELDDWLRNNIRYIIAAELVFTIAFFSWAFFRAYTPDITATEKPMEFAFLNGILQSDHFPPRDPWLAGYAISYYYFGYIIVAMLTLLSGVPSSVAFNLAIALLFALSAAGAYGLTYNLTAGLRSHNAGESSLVNSRASLFFPVFAPIFLVLIGNLEGLFEAVHSAGLASPDFWNWLDVRQLAEVPITGSFAPIDNWWWWRASRVVHDVVLGQTQEVIDEFPQFSFLLGDMHPHVLALPFTFLALAAAQNLLGTPRDAIRSLRSMLTPDIILLPLILGGLFFLNTWDILPYGFILVAAFAIGRYRAESKWDPLATRELIIFVAALGVLSLVLYFPFYLGFQSQAGGILPVLFVKTRLHQYLIMFGLFVFILGALLWRLFSERAARPSERLSKIITSAAPFFGFPILLILGTLLAVTLIPFLRDSIAAFLPGSTGNPLSDIVTALVLPLRNDPWLAILLALILTTIVYLLRTQLMQFEPSVVFVLLITFTGFLLTFGVEFLYLRDQFATRMNTVFKFYFQAWTLFSIAAGYAVYYLATRLNGMARAVWFAGFALLLGASLVYPTFAIPSRANNFKGMATLDGIHWIQGFSPGDYDAIQWLRANAPRGSVIVEAVGDAYSYGNRISMATGLPTPLGWVNHENQWRGNTKLFKDDNAGIDREADVRRIYQSLDAQETLTLLAKYDIKFVVVGGTEKSKYGLTQSQQRKFERILKLVAESNDTRIYAR